MASKSCWLQWATLLAVLVTLILAAGAYTRSTTIDYGKIQSIVGNEVSSIKTLTTEDIVNAIGKTDNEKIDEIYNEILEEDRIKQKAEELAIDELNTKDFKKDLADFLESEIEEIEDIDYKDIVEISVRDVDSVVSNDEAEVTIEFKAYVNNYGDEDEEEKARVEVTFYVSDLDPDEDFEDAEVNNWSDLELIRFY